MRHFSQDVSKSDVRQQVFTALAAGPCFLFGRAETGEVGQPAPDSQSRVCQLARDSRNVFLGGLGKVSRGSWVWEGEGLL